MIPDNPEQVKSILFTVFHSSTNLTKTIEVEDGRLVKRTNGHNPTMSERFDASTLREVIAKLDGLTPKQAVGWGIHNAEADLVTITLASKLPDDAGPTLIARTKSAFGWSQGPGILLVDIDEPHTPEGAREQLLRAASASGLGDWSNVEMCYRPSASAGCYLEGDDPVNMLHGGRIYVAVPNAGDIPELGERLVQGLWLSGQGRVEVSKSGQALLRQLLDSSVWQPNRLDFACPAVLGEGVARNLQPTIWWGTEGVLATGIEKCTTSEETNTVSLANRDRAAAVKALVSNAIAAAEPRLRAARERYVTMQLQQTEEAAIAAGTRGDDLDNLRNSTRDRLTSAVEYQVLNPSFILYLNAEMTEKVTVGEVLDNPSKWHKKPICDPLEPEGTFGKAKIFTNARPLVHSYIHGGRKYRLEQGGVVSVGVMHDSNTAEYNRSLIASMHKAFPAEFYRHSGGMVRVSEQEGRIVELNEYNLPIILSDKMVFMTSDGGVKVNPRPMSLALAKRVLTSASMGDEYAPLPEIIRVSKRPMWLPKTGEVISDPGYAPSIKTYLATSMEWPTLVELHSIEEARQACAALVMPYRDFNIIRLGAAYDRTYAEAVALATILTAQARQTVLGPVLLIGAERAGDGKTYLQKCLVAEMGERSKTTAYSHNKDEATKRLVAALQQSNPYLSIDNHDGAIGGGELEGLTDKAVDETHGIRLLGGNIEFPFYNDRLITVTGIHLRPSGEAMSRRSMVVTLASGRGTSSGAAWANRKMSLPFAPHEYILDNYKERHMLGLSLLLWSRKQGGEGCESLKTINSMADWSRDIQRVVWRVCGVDVGEVLYIAAADAAQASDRLGARGRLVMAAWEMLRKSVLKSRGGFMTPSTSMMLKQSEYRKDVADVDGLKIAFTTKMLRDWLGLHDNDPDGFLRRLLDDPRMLSGMAATYNGLKITKASTEGKVAYFAISGTPEVVEEDDD